VRVAADVSTQARASAVALEDLIRNDSKEIGALIAANGTTLAKHTGRADRVPFTPQELFSGLGATFTHNHPGNTGPSVRDLEIGRAFEFHEVRVVTPDHRYMIWPADRIKVADLQAEYDLETARVVPLLRDEVRCNQLHPSDFGSELVHRTWFRLASRLGFNYRREES